MKPHCARPLPLWPALALTALTALLAHGAPPQGALPVERQGKSLNADLADLQLFAQRPKPRNELPRAATFAARPPADIVPFAGLSPQDACDKASLPVQFR